MKKHLFLGLLAASLSLAACGKNKEPEQPSGPVDPLTPAERQNATATNTVISDIVKDAYGEEVAASTSEYVLARSEHAAQKGVDATKIASYIDEAKTLDWEDPTTVLSFVLSVHEDEGLDDAIYFGVALGQSLLKAGTLGAPEEQRPYFTAALADVEKEGDKIPENVYAVLDGTITAVESVMALFAYDDPTKLSNVMQVVLCVLSGQVLNTTSLKGAFSEIRAIVDEFAKVEANVSYIGDFAIEVGVDLLDVVVDIPEEFAPFIAELKVDDFVEALFGGVKGIFETLDTLPEKYYTHLGEITLPAESYAYAVLGALEALVPETEELTPEEIAALPKQLIAALNMMYEALEDYIPEEATTVIEALLEDENLEALIGAVIQLFADVSSVDLSFVTSEKLAHVVGVYFSAIDDSSMGYSFVEYDYDDFMGLTNLPEAVEELLPYDELETAHGVGSFETKESGAKVIEATDSEVHGYVVDYEIIYRYSVVDEEPQEEFMADITIKEVDVEYESLQDIAVFINEFLTFLAVKEGTDALIEDVLNVLHPAVALFSTYVLPMLDEETAEQIGKVYFMLAMIDAMAQNASVRSNIKAVVNDLFVVVKDIFSAFLPNGETPAAANFSKFFVILTTVSVEEALTVLYGTVPVAKLQSVKTLATDVYNLANALGLSNTLVNAICEVLETDPSTIKSASDFAELIYGFVANMLASK